MGGLPYGRANVWREIKGACGSFLRGRDETLSIVPFSFLWKWGMGGGVGGYCAAP